MQIRKSALIALSLLTFVSTHTTFGQSLQDGLIFQAGIDTGVTNISGSTLISFTNIEVDANHLGVEDSAWRFDGTNSSFTFAITNLPSGASPRTLSLWVKPSLRSAPINEHIAGYGSYDPGQAFGYFVAAENKNFVGYLAFEDIHTQASASNEWLHLTLTYDGTTARTYVNGFLDSTKAISLDTRSDGFFVLGARRATEQADILDNFFEGSVGEVKLWNRALTGFEVRQVFSLPQPLLNIRVSQVELCWETLTNQWYNLEFQSSVTSNNWTLLSPNWIPGTGGLFCTNCSVSIAQPQRLYRVVVTNAAQ